MGKSDILLNNLTPEIVTVEPNPPWSSSCPEFRQLTRICELLTSISDFKMRGTTYIVLVIILYNMLQCPNVLMKLIIMYELLVYMFII